MYFRFHLLEMSEEELDESLRHFYAEAWTKTGEEYGWLSLLGFGNPIERHFIAKNSYLKIT